MRICSVNRWSVATVSVNIVSFDTQWILSRNDCASDCRMLVSQIRAHCGKFVQSWILENNTVELDQTVPLLHVEWCRPHVNRVKFDTLVSSGEEIISLGNHSTFRVQFWTNFENLFVPDLSIKQWLFFNTFLWRRDVLRNFIILNSVLLLIDWSFMVEINIFRSRIGILEVGEVVVVGKVVQKWRIVRRWRCPDESLGYVVLGVFVVSSLMLVDKVLIVCFLLFENPLEVRMVDTMLSEVLPLLTRCWLNVVLNIVKVVPCVSSLRNVGTQAVDASGSWSRIERSKWIWIRNILATPWANFLISWRDLFVHSATFLDWNSVFFENDALLVQ